MKINAKHVEILKFIAKHPGFYNKSMRCGFKEFPIRSIKYLVQEGYLESFTDDRFISGYSLWKYNLTDKGKEYIHEM